MARRLIVRTRCPICGDFVEEVPIGTLRKEPHYHNAEFVDTRTGYRQYIHSSCWYGMIAEQKRGKEHQKEESRSEMAQTLLYLQN